MGGAFCLSRARWGSVSSGWEVTTPQEQMLYSHRVLRGCTALFKPQAFSQAPVIVIHGV